MLKIPQVVYAIGNVKYLLFQGYKIRNLELKTIYK